MVTGMATHVGLYARQSAGRANKSEVSTETQLEAALERARTLNPDAIAEYKDVDRSAFKTDVVREDYERLLRDCKSGRINVVIVYYISRFTRADPLETIPVVSELLNLGVTLISVTEGEFRKGNLMDLIHLIMRLDAAHNESKNKSDAIGKAKRKAKELGGYVGGTAPFGFKLVPETVIDPARNKPIVIQVPYEEPAESWIIDEAVTRIERHMGEPITPGKTHPGSLSGICAAFNHEGDKPTRGQRVGKDRADSGWQVKTLGRILMDPRIAGMDAEPVYGVNDEGATTTNIVGYRILRDGDGEPIPFARPLIDPARWWRLQPWLKSRGRGRGLARGTSLLSGLRSETNRAITTCECGRSMGSLNTTHQVSKPSYRCTRARGKELPGEHVGGNTIVQEYLDAYVARRIFALINASDQDDPEALGVIKAATKRFARTVEAPETVEQRQALVQERAEVVRALEELYDAQEAGGYSNPIGQRRFITLEAKLSERLEAVEGRIKTMDASSSPELPLGSWVPDEGDPIGDGSWWALATLEERREFIALFVDRITVRKALRRGGRTWTEEQMHERVHIAWVFETQELSVDLAA
jgi:DNA invertase Pin-like site-specific DNA recombinase